LFFYISNRVNIGDITTYESKQRNLGATVDADLFGGAGSSVSLNGGKPDISSDYAAVGEQAIIATQSSDLVLGGKGEFIGRIFN
jgi:filamentous hemagglutinin